MEKKKWKVNGREKGAWVGMQETIKNVIIAQAVKKTLWVKIIIIEVNTEVQR